MIINRGQFKKGHKEIPGRIEALPRGKTHWKWSEKTTYRSGHDWINKHFGKPLECEHCDFTSENNRQFHWANLSGEYLRKKTDWKRLCVRCHQIMDRVHERGLETKRKTIWV